MNDSRDLALAGQLRAALCSFVASAGTKRCLPTLFHLGTPGGEHVSLPHVPSYDAGLRADLATRALDGLDVDISPVPWLTRTGELDLTDADFAWFAAAHEAFDRHGLAFPGFFVITRRGWINVATDEAQIWQRIRNRRRPA